MYITKYARAQVNTCVLVPPPGQLHPRQIPAAVTNARLPASKPAESSSQQASACNSHPKMAHSRAPGAQTWWSCGFPIKKTPKKSTLKNKKSRPSMRWPSLVAAKCSGLCLGRPKVHQPHLSLQGLLQPRGVRRVPKGGFPRREVHVSLSLSLVGLVCFL